MNPQYRHIVKHSRWRGCCALCALLLLAGCASGTSAFSLKSNSPQDQAQAAVDNREIDTLLAEAAKQSSPASEALRLEAAEKLSARGEADRSLALLFNIDSRNLPDPAFLRYTELYGRWAVEKNQHALAHNLLLNGRVELLLPEAEHSLALALRELRAQVFDASHEAGRAVTERTAMTPLLSGDEAQEKNCAAIWLSLQQMPESEIQTLDRSDQELDGWLELMHIASARELDIDAQVNLLNGWLDRFPNHPAAQHLPTELRSLQAAIRQKPQRVTLLLPLSGNLQKAGETIRDGFIAAYYQALEHHYAVPTIHIVDSQQGGNFLALYDSVTGTGQTDLVIGPLEKDKVALLQNRGHLAVPTLALNDSGTGTHQTIADNLYLFALNPEDDARQVADEARLQGHERALVIAPDNDWGQRLGSAFQQEWQAQGGTVLGEAWFDAEKQDYSVVLQDALGITRSKARKKQLRQWSGMPLEFEPRRRQDIDMIFLATRPGQARQVKPLLAFYYARDIPIYATSSIYTGEPDPSKDADLNGVQLLVSPWVLEDSELKQSVERDLSSDAALQTLYALGADAWRLHARLQVLSASGQSRLQGYTGLLRMDDHRRIERQQTWVVMEQGKINAAPAGVH